jgi:hypothetical protein
MGMHPPCNQGNNGLLFINVVRGHVSINKRPVGSYKNSFGIIRFLDMIRALSPALLKRAVNNRFVSFSLISA